MNRLPVQLAKLWCELPPPSVAWPWFRPFGFLARQVKHQAPSSRGPSCCGVVLSPGTTHLAAVPGMHFAAGLLTTISHHDMLEVSESLGVLVKNNKDFLGRSRAGPITRADTTKSRG